MARSINSELSQFASAQTPTAGPSTLRMPYQWHCRAPTCRSAEKPRSLCFTERVEAGHSAFHRRGAGMRL